MVTNCATLQLTFQLMFVEHPVNYIQAQVLPTGKLKIFRNNIVGFFILVASRKYGHLSQV